MVISFHIEATLIRRKKMTSNAFNKIRKETAKCSIIFKDKKKYDRKDKSWKKGE
jgi:hypothetical protein